ncbi:MAG: glycosyltransferase family 2 protein [Acidobacteriaceae bacterium]|nr:glycosyltransferase family 2 protein [Acidobacteriaceae bacterium]
MAGSVPSISVVVPCYNEQEGILECHRRLCSVISFLGSWYEIVYVDDGSKDNTAPLLERLYDSDPNITVIELSRNFGHQTAVTAGLEVAKGQIVIIIDSDLQDPPELIPEMIRIWQQGYEVVYGVRDSREGESGFKIWTAKAFYRVINRLSDVEIPIDTGDFRLLDRKAVDAMNRLPERQRLLRGMCSWIGFRQYGLKYARAARFAGTTKYPIRKMLKLALDGVASFSTVPLRLVSIAGLISAIFSVLGIVYALVLRIFTHIWVPGWTLLFIGMLMIGGLQMISLGIVGEYVGRIYTEAKQRPLYFTRSVLHRRGAAEAPKYEDESISVRLN